MTKFKLPRLGGGKPSTPHPSLAEDVEIYSLASKATDAKGREAAVQSVYKKAGITLTGDASKRLGGVYRRVEAALNSADAAVKANAVALCQQFGVPTP